MTLAQEMTRALGGKWFGRYGMACCPAHQDRSPSLSLANGQDGRLLLKCHAGCAFTDIRAALPFHGGRIPNNRAGGAVSHDARRADAKRSRQAQALWDAARPARGSLAESYLRGRGIRGPLPDSLRFLNPCWHPSTKRAPVLLGKVTGGEGFAVHRTYLAPDGRGKASFSPAKAMLGPTRGGAVRLSRGDRLVVAEGVETALSLLSGLLTDRPAVWAALSASGMVGLRLPIRPGSLTIAADGDATGRAAADQLARRADALGWRVSLLTASDGQDWNDVLRAREGCR